MLLETLGTTITWSQIHAIFKRTRWLDKWYKLLGRKRKTTLSMNSWINNEFVGVVQYIFWIIYSVTITLGILEVYYWQSLFLYVKQILQIYVEA